MPQMVHARPPVLTLLVAKASLVPQLIIFSGMKAWKEQKARGSGS